MIVVGLTGGIATGKSTVSKIIMEMGIPVIDADKISREIVNRGEAVFNKITEIFGSEILTEGGELDRKKLRNIVFNDKEKLNLLNQITHPEIKNRINKKIQEYKNENKKICVLDAALLIEANFHSLVDIVVLVYTDLNTQIERLMKRDLISKEDALKIINSQMKFEEKVKYADYVIDNSKSIEYTIMQVNKIFSNIMSMEAFNE